MNPFVVIKKAIRLVNIKIKEKKYDGIKYLLQKNKSDTLVVIFSAFSEIGKPPRYNYLEALNDFNINKLFILDNYGYNKAGSYYLGENGVIFLPPRIIKLIDQVKEEVNATRLITLGSSKGGAAALMYGAKTNSDYCIIAAPQYYIGTYLNSQYRYPILNGIMGNTNEESVIYLDNVVRECIKRNRSDKKPVIFIHYSPKEHTYTEQIKDLLITLREYNYKVFEDNDYEYINHSDVGAFFIPYLKRILETIV